MTFETLNIFASGIAANLAVVVAEVTIEALRRFRPPEMVGTGIDSYPKPLEPLTNDGAYYGREMRAERPAEHSKLAGVQMSEVEATDELQHPPRRRYLAVMTGWSDTPRGGRACSLREETRA